VKHTPTPHPLQDAYALGQLAMGRIHADLASADCLTAAKVILATKYTNPEWLASHVRMFRKSADKYHHAMDLKAFWAEPVMELTQ